MRILIAFILMIASACGAQTVTLGGPATTAIIGKAEAPPPVLKCPKYQHQQYTPAHCANTCPLWASTCTAACSIVAEENICVDDLHVVKEWEWQELMENQKRLQNALDHLLKAAEHQAVFDDKIVKGMEQSKKPGSGKSK